MMVEERFSGGHFPKCIVLQAIFWYLRYSSSYRDIEELIQKRGVELHHATFQRWVVKYTPLLETKFRKRKKAVAKTAEFRQKFNRNFLLIGSVINLGKGDDHILCKLCDRTMTTYGISQ